MNMSPYKDASMLLNNVSNITRRPHVCMHVLRDTANDVRLRRSATALAEAGWQVTVVDVVEKARSMLHPKTSTSHTMSYTLQHIIANSDFQNKRFAGRNSLQILPMFICSLIRLLKQRADIYHACEWTALPACSIAAFIRRKPLIFEAYELPLQDQILLTRQIGRRLLYAWMHLWLRYVLPRCAAVITVSPLLVQEMQHTYRLPQVVLIRNIPTYQAITKTHRIREYLHLSEQTRIALYQGNLQLDRGLDRLVLAATYLEPECVLVMMGPNIGTTQVELEQLIAHQQISDHVKIIPAVPYEVLPIWTASADIGLTIIPLDYTKNMRMCLPNKLFEYIQAGLPILSSLLPAVQEILETYNVGKVVPSMEPADIGAAINMLLHDPVELKRMHDNALQAACQDLCWHKESRQLIQLYQQVLLT